MPKERLWLPPLLKGALCLMLSASALSLTASVTIKLNQPSQPPTRIVRNGTNCIHVTYNFPEITQVIVPAQQPVYHSIPGFGHCNLIGFPKVPVRIDTFTVPEGYEASVTYTTSSPKTVTTQYATVEPPLTDSGELLASTSSSTYAFQGTFPLANAEIINSYTLRGENMVEIAVAPVICNTYTKRTDIYESITYTLTFTPINEANEDVQIYGLDTMDEYQFQLPLSLLDQSLIINPNKIGKISALDKLGFEGTVGYLIVTTDKYLNEVKSFEKWKKILGFNTHILSRENWTDGDEVKNAIRNARKEYANVQYILIVGDHDDVPGMISTLKRIHPTDIYYGTSDDSQFIPECYLGRISVNTIGEANNVLNKLARLEMCPCTEDVLYNNALHCARFQSKETANNMEDRRFILTSEEIRDYIQKQGRTVKRLYTAELTDNPWYYDNEYFSFGGEITYDLRRPYFLWACTPEEIAEQINMGKLYVMYRGHGNPNGWTFADFYTSSLSLLENYELYPHVFSITCLTGKFDDQSFAEELLKLPCSGAASVIAATQDSWSGVNDCLAEG